MTLSENPFFVLGLSVDTSRIDGVLVGQSNTVTVGAGSTVGQLQAQLAAAGRALPVSTHDSVGVTGMALVHQAAS